MGQPAFPGLVFVGGSPRSGTTLLQRMLDSHPEIFGGPEFDRTNSFVRLRNELHTSIKNKRISQYTTFEEVDSAIRWAYLQILVAREAGAGVRLVAEKTPWNVLRFQELLNLFPEAKAINVVRDPRAVVASMLKVGERARKQGAKSPTYTRNLTSACEVVEACYEEARKAAHAEPERTLNVNYERLVAQPELELEKVCAFLGVDFEPRMSQPNAVAHSLDNVENIENSPYLQKETWGKEPVASRTHSWEKDLSRYSKDYISSFFINSPVPVGYSLEREDNHLVRFVTKIRLVGARIRYYFMCTLQKGFRFLLGRIGGYCNGGVHRYY